MILAFLERSEAVARSYLDQLLANQLLLGWLSACSSKGISY